MMSVTNTGVPSKKLIWILDQTETLGPLLRQVFGNALRLKGFTVIEDLKRSLQKAKKDQAPSLVLSESRINGQPISELIKELISSESLASVPFLVVSGCNDLDLITSCLDAGANDYLVNPVDPNLLIAKINSILKIDRLPTLNTDLNLDLSISTLTATNEKGRSAKLTLKEFQILSNLLAHPSGVSARELRNRVWGRCNVVPKSLDVHLFKLRRKLGMLRFQVKFDRSNHYRLIQEPKAPLEASDRPGVSFSPNISDN